MTIQQSRDQLASRFGYAWAALPKYLAMAAMGAFAAAIALTFIGVFCAEMLLVPLPDRFVNAGKLPLTLDS